MAPEGPAGEERETLRTLLDSLRLRLALSERPERYFRYGKDEVGGDTERHPSFETRKAGGGTLEEIAAEAARCSLCPLHATRTRVVFGEGNPRARLVFVGEAPGADEDRQGRPFVGRAGQLLTRIIEAMKLKREDVYICNILKCRPPGNRDPRGEEIAACEPYLVRQLAAIGPEVICALGTFAARTLLKTEAPITVLRGRFHSYQGVPLMPTYHPAYLLRNPEAKKQVWEDVRKIMEVLKDKKGVRM